MSVVSGQRSRYFSSSYPQWVALKRFSGMKREHRAFKIARGLYIPSMAHRYLGDRLARDV